MKRRYGTPIRRGSSASPTPLLLATIVFLGAAGPGSTAARAQAKPAQPATAPKAKPAAATKPLMGEKAASLAGGSGVLPAGLSAEKVELRDAQGQTRYVFKNKGRDAVKFYDAAGTELCKLTVTTDKLKVKSADDTPLFELKYKSDKTTLRFPPNDTELYKLKPRGDRLEIQTADDRLAYVIRADGEAAVVVEKPDGQRVCRSERKGNSTTVSNPAGSTLVSTTALADPLALAFFGLPDLDPSMQAACLVSFLRKTSP